MRQLILTALVAALVAAAVAFLVGQAGGGDSVQVGLSRELERIDAELGRLWGEVARIREQLGGAATRDVVEELAARISGLEAELERLRAALKRLNDSARDVARLWERLEELSREVGELRARLEELAAGRGVLSVRVSGDVVEIVAGSPGTYVMVEVPDGDAVPVPVRYVVDGDTIRLARRVTQSGRGDYLRLVGYNAPEGTWTKIIILSACGGEPSVVYVDVDDYEQVDRYGRALGYAWCPVEIGGAELYVFINKYALVNESGTVEQLSIPPDEHPVEEITREYVVRLVCTGVEARLRIITTTVNAVIDCGGEVVVRGGRYRVSAPGNATSTTVDLLPD